MRTRVANPYFVKALTSFSFSSPVGNDLRMSIKLSTVKEEEDTSILPIVVEKGMLRDLMEVMYTIARSYAEMV